MTKHKPSIKTSNQNGTGIGRHHLNTSEKQFLTGIKTRQQTKVKRTILRSVQFSDMTGLFASYWS